MQKQNHLSTYVISRRGTSQPFAAQKLRASIAQACVAARTPVGSAELTAEYISREIMDWLSTKPEVTWRDIGLRVTDRLKIYNPAGARKYARSI